MATIDLDDVNFALRELVRLQLAGELSTEDAWRERQQLLDAVEANWVDVSDLVSGQVSDQSIAAVTADASADYRRVSAEPALGQQLMTFITQRLWPRLRQLSLIWALLGLTIVTCLYVASL